MLEAMVPGAVAWLRAQPWDHVVHAGMIDGIHIAWAGDLTIYDLRQSMLVLSTSPIPGVDTGS